MSRIDGAATVQDLADLTSLAPEDVDVIVQKLVVLGVAQWADGAISLPRASMRPASPPAATFTRGSSAPRLPAEKRTVTESQAPSATREPSIVPPPRRASAPYLQSAGATDEVDPARLEQSRSAPHAGGMTARVQLRSSAGGQGAPTTPTPRRPAAGEHAEPSSTVHDHDTFVNAPTLPPPGARAVPPITAPSITAAPDPAAPIAAPPIATASPTPVPIATSSAPPAATPSAPAASSSPPGGEIDLSPERRQRIDELYPVLELMDHYHVLGLDPSVDLKQVRARYFELSKVFHPDTAFRKNLGAYKPKMEAIFTRLTEAYDVLGRKKSRAEYDAYLELQGDTRAAEAALRAPSQTPAIAKPTPAPPATKPTAPPTVAVPSAPPVVAAPSAPPIVATPIPPASPPPPAPTSSPPDADEPRATLSEAGRRRARELLEKRLGGARSSASRLPAAASSAASPPRAREEIVRDLASTLKGAASLTGGLDAVQRHLIEARRREQDGDLATASRELRLAVALAPDRYEIKVEQQRVSGLLAAQLADKYEQAAEYEERHKKWAAAALSWSKVVDGRPDDADAILRAANALLEAKGDLHRAQKLAQRATELRPDAIAPRIVLGRVFIAAGLHLNARRELERAALLDPGDQIVKNLLRDLKG